MQIARLSLGALLLTSAAAPDSGHGVYDASGIEARVVARCSALVAREFGDDVQIISAVHVDAAAPGTVSSGSGRSFASGIPAHCRIEGMINARMGAEGKAYGIGFAIALPDQWSGRFLLQGGGGLNGSVAPPLGNVAAGDVPALARGFAVISHDSGHKGAVFDASFMADQRAALDFAEASVRTVTIVGKAITTGYYGKPIGHSYMAGCSTGGREGMLASQRYPELFDGIVVGAPAMRTGDSNLAIAWSAVQFNQAAPRDKDGLAIVPQIFPSSDRKLILKGMLDQCDALDGLADGMIMNQAQCRFQPARLRCKTGKAEGCLSKAQVSALDRAFAGPKDAAGYPVYTPVPYDTGIVDAGGYLPTGAPGVFGPAPRELTIDLDARLQAIRANAAQRLTDTHVWTNLNTFLGRGGKILFYHGVSDAWFSALATWNYWQRARVTNGPAWDAASRFYMVPGMGHCGGGNAFDNFDLLGPVVDWVEKGRAPGAVLASRRGPAKEERPMCPHPSYPHHVGGDPTRPDSFECRAPKS
ncbi:tannase/feruloyl esterase family alpha/beta hydrolase [Sphingomonas psychrotolerans]|uniref:Tannase/feruloyl esterase family alpha/beta hydrolase n=1 Tax=Sphingomonas psychrotolerans TaxID=1327635 RepID=A0A2K8ME86_9SPHN|nr:tannase/feruloyl esterase family alpha/beta hydrolase [Sphingomonas psychrotolerans]ATY32210.1 tannase/feruloyl esterase family alpha/beta hydrolase [Sphingomonas psychrotolerans]